MLLKIFAVFVCFSAVIGQIFGSSIPMWEYLTKDEKVRVIHLLESRKQPAIPKSFMFDLNLFEYSFCERVKI